jgi:hypothetical protein
LLEDKDAATTADDEEAGPKDVCPRMKPDREGRGMPED